MAGGRKKGNRRIDAAIDYFTIRGYAASDVRRIVNRLVYKVYGTDEAWALVEEDNYNVVYEVLFEEEEQQKQCQLQLLQQQEEEEAVQQLEAPPAEEVHPMPIDLQLPQHQEEEEEESVQQLEAPPAEEVQPMHIDLPTFPTSQAVVPLPAATAGTRRPCYGWLSESESDSEDDQQSASQLNKVDIQRPGGGLLSKRKNPSRWDVKPLNWDGDVEMLK